MMNTKMNENHHDAWNTETLETYLGSVLSVASSLHSSLLIATGPLYFSSATSEEKKNVSLIVQNAAIKRSRVVC